MNARALAEIGRLDEAIASARLVTELAPDRPGLWGALAQFLLQARQFEASEAAAKRALELRPDVGWIASLARRAAAGG